MATIAPVDMVPPSSWGHLEGFPAMSSDETFDLQAHSLHSDGALPPSEVVKRAAAAGVRRLALSDHDTVDGVAEALDAARAQGIVNVPAVELSSVGAGVEDLHILGYGIDHTDPELLATLQDFRADRGRRIFAMADRLRELGFVLDEAHYAHHDAPGRPHLAKAILTEPANAAKLASEGIATANELFPAYLVPGAPGYVGRSRPTVAEAIDVIHRAGGVAVWAHPFWDLDELGGTLDEFAGLDGLEAFYITHDEAQTRELVEEARTRGLLTTGSSDFHGPEHERFNRFLAYETFGMTPDLGPIGVLG
jgi:predicted metal-dependent phosphoesterase TrpH